MHVYILEKEQRKYYSAENFKILKGALGRREETG